MSIEVLPNKPLELTRPAVTKFACANLPPVWAAADAGC